MQEAIVMSDIENTRLCVGVIVGVHGVRGALKVKSFTERAEDLFAYGALCRSDGSALPGLKPTGAAKGVLLAKMDGIADRDAALALKGVELFIERDRLPPADPETDEFYHADLIGLRAETSDGSSMGTVRAVHDFGAGDLIELVGGPADHVLIPFTRDAVPMIDVAGGRLVIVPPEGLLGAHGDEAEERP